MNIKDLNEELDKFLINEISDSCAQKAFNHLKTIRKEGYEQEKLQDDKSLDKYREILKTDERVDSYLFIDKKHVEVRFIGVHYKDRKQVVILDDTFKERLDAAYNNCRKVNESVFDDKCKEIQTILGDKYELSSINYGKQAGYKQINYSPKGEKYTYSVDGKNWDDAINNLKNKLNEAVAEESKLYEIVDYIYSKLPSPTKPLLSIDVVLNSFDDIGEDWIVADYNIDDDLTSSYNHDDLIKELYDLNDKIRIFDEITDLGSGILEIYLSIGEETPYKVIDGIIKGMEQIPAIIKKYYKE